MSQTAREQTVASDLRLIATLSNGVTNHWGEMSPSIRRVYLNMLQETADRLGRSLGEGTGNQPD